MLEELGRLVEVEVGLTIALEDPDDTRATLYPTIGIALMLCVVTDTVELSEAVAPLDVYVRT